MTPKQALQAASKIEIPVPGGQAKGLGPTPGLSPAEIDSLERELPGPIPGPVRELLGFSSGLKRTPIGNVEFRGLRQFEFRSAFPSGLAIASDSYGNFFIVDIRPDSGEWGPVFFVSHDPPVIVKEAADLAGFISKLAGGSSAGGDSSFASSSQKAADEIWKDDPYLVAVDTARSSVDPIIREFADQLNDKWSVIDLRASPIGSGFSWGRGGPDSEVIRRGAELIFGVPGGKRRGVLSRLFERPT